MKDKFKRNRKKQLRKLWRLRCFEFNERVRKFGLSLHWSRILGKPRSATEFSLWRFGEYKTPIIDYLTLEEMEKYFERLVDLKVFW